MSPTATSVPTETKTDESGFNAPTVGLSALEIGAIATALGVAVRVLDPDILKQEARFHGTPEPVGAVIVWMSMNSPWTMLLAVAHAPERSTG